MNPHRHRKNADRTMLMRSFQLQPAKSHKQTLMDFLKLTLKMKTVAVLLAGPSGSGTGCRLKLVRSLHSEDQYIAIILITSIELKHEVCTHKKCNDRDCEARKCKGKKCQEKEFFDDDCRIGWVAY